jgi:hypothetical protein
MTNEPKEPFGEKQRSKATVSAILPDGSLVELVYQPDARQTVLCVCQHGEIRYETTVADEQRRLAPLSNRNNLLRNEVVLFPSHAAEYGSAEALVEEIREFIHRYVDLTPLFEQVASYYALFSWVHDAFNELPYLRVLGDAGSGKTRFLLVAGAICYKPIFASGASTVSPLFRILDLVRGTLIVDEGDFRFSDEKAELVKILNNGNGRGFPVLRSESINGREFSPRAYHVFGPKLIATRGFFQDRALETRCITEQTGGRSLRQDVPINLPESYKEEALLLRNKLLMFRFRNLHRARVHPELVDRSVEPRLSQVFVPLLSVIEEPSAREALSRIMREYHRALIVDRGMDLEATVLTVIHDLQAVDVPLSIKEVTARLTESYGEEFERKITPHWVGRVVRRKLGLRTEKRHGSYVIVPEEAGKLARLYERYGIAGDLGDSGDSEKGEKGPDAPTAPLIIEL